MNDTHIEEQVNLTDFERLDIVVKHSCLSVVDFAKSIGRSTGFYYEMKCGKEGRDHITNKLAKAICDVYKDININWLINGEGEMLQPVNKQNASTSKRNSTYISANNNIVESNNIASLLEMLKKKDEQIERLLTLLEKCNNK